VLILLSLILMATTVFPNIDVTQVALIGGAVIAVGLAGFALATLRTQQGAPEPSTDESAIPREQWTMPPLTLLSRPTWSRGRKIALGHTDGGELVRRLYGHRDHERALERVTAAYGRTASFTQARLW
jgi:hypothetical protein